VKACGIHCVQDRLARICNPSTHDEQNIKSDRWVFCGYLSANLASNMCFVCCGNLADLTLHVVNDQ
jgi:hypothetical protein